MSVQRACGPVRAAGAEIIDRGATGGIGLIVAVHRRERKSVMWTVLLLVLVLFAIGAMPAWPYSQGWGYYPSTGLGVIVLVVLLLLFTGRI